MRIRIDRSIRRFAVAGALLLAGCGDGTERMTFDVASKPSRARGKRRDSACWFGSIPLRSGRISTTASRDSSTSPASFADPRPGTVGFAHNFWTTEPLEAEATYRLRAVRSDGAATTALVEMPPDLEVTLVFWEVPEQRGTWTPRQALWTIPLPLCQPVEPRPAAGEPCTMELDASSASIAGTVTRGTCSHPMQLPTMRLTERYAGGGAVVRLWRPDWDGA